MGLGIRRAPEAADPGDPEHAVGAEAESREQASGRYLRERLGVPPPILDLDHLAAGQHAIELRGLAAGALQQELAHQLRVRRERVGTRRVAPEVHLRHRRHRWPPDLGASERLVAQRGRPVFWEGQLIVLLAGLVATGGQRGRGITGDARGRKDGEHEQRPHLLILTRRWRRAGLPARSRCLRLAAMSPPSLAYLAGGQLHLKLGEAPVRAFDSAFGQQVRDRHLQIHQKHSWKEEGRGARFMGNLLWGMPERDPVLRFAITSLSRGAGPGELLYTLDTEGRTAVCLFRAEDASERRLLHGSAQRIRDLRTAPGREHIACSVLHADGTASIAVMTLDATDLREVTEGDAQDRFPAWAPGGRTRLVYQSASLGRDRAGQVSALGPSEVHLLDVESGTLETLASGPDRDFL